MVDTTKIPAGNFRGHERQSVWLESPDAELTEVGPETPCGEYLRRHWMPVAMTNQITDLPYRLRVLGEDLVLFREKKSGGLGLVHLHCAHRNMSLEFGIVEEDGIRCSYHGWKYGLDGSLLDTPCEPPNSPLKDRVCVGAYPVVEYKGLAFTYMGPQSERPEFPMADTFDQDGDEMVPYLISSPCNWLQVMENAFDPYHVVFLHTRAVRTQFIDAFAEMPLIEYHERAYGDFYTNTRRVDNFVWTRYFGRCGLSRWVTPVDDFNTMVIAWRHFREGDDPRGLTNPDEVGFGTTDFYGQGGDRDYEQRQRDPGDYDAWVSQGPQNIHAREKLCFTDEGIGRVRRKLRAAIRDVAAGNPAKQPSMTGVDAIPTFGGDTVLEIPPQADRDDKELLQEIANKVAHIYVSADHLSGENRVATVQQQLQEYEAKWS